MESTAEASMTGHVTKDDGSKVEFSCSTDDGVRVDGKLFDDFHSMAIWIRHVRTHTLCACRLPVRV